MRNIFIILMLALVFHFLIWEAGMGINMLLFSWATSLLIYWLKPDIAQHPMVRALLAGWCLSAVFVVWHHSLLSCIVFWLFAVVVVGYVQSTRVHFWMAGLLESARGLLLGWIISLRALGREPGHTSNTTQLWRKIRLWLIPVIILIPFYLIYSAANTTFGKVNEQLGQWLGQLFNFELDWSRALVFLLGWALAVAFLGRRSGIPFLHEWVEKWQFPLVRKRQRVPWPIKTTSLKQEYQTAVYTFAVLNGLLLLINVLDLIWVWFSPQERTAAELSQYVHEGTWLLIFSIVLAMLVVMLFLRGNLNFLPGNQRLKQLANIWLAQNAFLALSVGVRNAHYIQHYGLAHGRIQVVFFLLVVLFGLYTMYRKIEGPKSIFYLFEVNGRAVLLALLVAAAFNWDSIITSYNLRQENPDTYYVQYLLTNNMVPLLEAAHSSTMLADRLNEEKLRSRANRLKKTTEKRDWRSWNWSTYRQLKAWEQYQAITPQ